MIMTDQDHDGSHIKALILNVFHTLWPSLLDIGYITSMITPIVKVSKGKLSKSFYNLTEYKAWLSKTENHHKWKSKYYKGLGTSTAIEARDYFKDMKKNDYIWTDKSEEKMNSLGAPESVFLIFAIYAVFVASSLKTVCKGEE